MQWDQPSRDNFYTLQNTAMLLRIHGNDLGDVAKQIFRVPLLFKRPGELLSPEELERLGNGHTQKEVEEYERNITYEAKARWGMRKKMGYQPPHNGNQ